MVESFDLFEARSEIPPPSDLRFPVLPLLAERPEATEGRGREDGKVDDDPGRGTEEVEDASGGGGILENDCDDAKDDATGGTKDVDNGDGKVEANEPGMNDAVADDGVKEGVDGINGGV